MDVVGRAETLRDPLADLLGGAVAGDAGGAEGAAEDRQRDPGVAPAHLLAHDREQQPGGIREALRHELPRVEADLRRLLDDGPRRLFFLVPLVTGGPHDLFGEVVHPLLDLLLILVEIEGELGHWALLAATVADPEVTGW